LGHGSGRAERFLLVWAAFGIAGALLADFTNGQSRNWSSCMDLLGNCLCRLLGHHCLSMRMRVEAKRSMPSIYDLKPGFQSLLRPLVNGLARCGATANQVTLAACCFAWRRMLDRVAHGGRMLLILPAVLFVRMALNAMDGMLARNTTKKARWRHPQRTWRCNRRRWALSAARGSAAIRSPLGGGIVISRF